MSDESSDSMICTYCTPEEVAETLDLPVDYDYDGHYVFDDMSHPKRSQVIRMILSNEDYIDKILKRSWREHRVENYLASLSNYWHDINSWRIEHYLQGGDYIQLRKDIRQWDPSKGDKLEMRTLMNHWVDLTDVVSTNGETGRNRIWFDYPHGKMYMYTRWWTQKYNSIRITYRYGSEEPVPYAINRMCCLLTASQILNMQAFNIKVGTGGDISGIRESMLRAWQDEINSIKSAWQRSGSVHSMLR